MFPCELKMCNTIDDGDVADEAYSLFAVVVHLGSRPDHGARAGAPPPRHGAAPGGRGAGSADRPPRS